MSVRWLDRRQFLATTGAAGLALAGQHAAFAQGRGDTLLVVQELGPNSLDMQGVGSNQTVNGLAWNCYDRLMTYGVKTLPDGTPSYDSEDLTPELAESWQVASDGMSCTFKLRKDATFHDGTPVTAKDVKWSFDRAVSVGGFPTFQMSAGSLEKREQFVAVDDHTFRVDFIRKDKMLMFNLAVVVPFVINSELAKKNATEADPWALAWLQATTRPAAAPTGSKAGSPAARPSSRASTTGRAARCRRSAASSRATSPPPARAAPCWSAATPTSRPAFRRRISTR